MQPFHQNSQQEQQIVDRLTDDPRLGKVAVSHKNFWGVVDTIHRRRSDGAELISIKNTRTLVSHSGLRPDDVRIFD